MVEFFDVVHPSKGPSSVLLFGGSVSTDQVPDEWSALSNKYCFRIGVGLPGRVAASGLPEAQRDISSLSSEVFLRTAMARSLGLRAACGLPLMSDGQCSKVIIFYSRKDAQPTEELMHHLMRICEARNLCGHIRAVERRALDCADGRAESTYAVRFAHAANDDLTVGQSGAFRHEPSRPSVASPSNFTRTGRMHTVTSCPDIAAAVTASVCASSPFADAFLPDASVFFGANAVSDAVEARNAVTGGAISVSPDAVISDAVSNGSGGGNGNGLSFYNVSGTTTLDGYDIESIECMNDSKELLTSAAALTPMPDLATTNTPRPFLSSLPAVHTAAPAPATTTASTTATRSSHLNIVPHSQPTSSPPTDRVSHPVDLARIDQLEATVAHLHRTVARLQQELQAQRDMSGHVPTASRT